MERNHKMVCEIRGFRNTGNPRFLAPISNYFSQFKSEMECVNWQPTPVNTTCKRASFLTDAEAALSSENPLG